MPKDYDVIVVGSGAGGSTIACRLARAGRRVLVIERGKRSTDPESIQSGDDLPQHRNRIEVDRDGRVHLHHRFHSYDIERSRWYLGQLKQVMKLTGASVRIGATGDKDEVHVAHQVGTARFGHDPARSVLNADCRLHDCENLYVVDGSFMPTSLGVGPALTIMANALRVGEHIASD